MSPSVGDRVSWNTEQGRTRGTVVERKTKAFQLAGHKFTASEDEPMFVVKSEKTGAKAAHKPSALRTLKSSDAPAGPRSSCAPRAPAPCTQEDRVCDAQCDDLPAHHAPRRRIPRKIQIGQSW